MLRGTRRTRGRGMAACLVLLLWTGAAEATRQVEEELVVGGRARRMQSLPLEPWIERLPKRPRFGPRRSTACTRGYVGTWTVHDGHLELIGLRGPGGQSVPLARLFPDRSGPIRATWFTGVLRVGSGREVRSVRMGFGTIHETTRLLRVRQGRVAGSAEVDALREGFLRSTKDLQWVALAPDHEPSASPWHDARRIGTAAFREQVPAGTPFRTRGVLHGEGGGTDLWVPATPGSEAVHLPVAGASPGKSSLPHVEVTVTWHETDGTLRLRCTKTRRLAPGETIHHPDYTLPDLAVRLARARAELASRPPVFLSDRLGVRQSWGLPVELHGTLERDDGPSVLGVEVAAPDVPAGRTVSATGRLEKWIVTRRMLEGDKRIARRFGARGPGTWYRLVHPETGDLAVARAP